MRTDTISRNDLNSENLYNKIRASVKWFESQTRLVKQKDGEIAALNKKLKQSEEKYKELS